MMAALPLPAVNPGGFTSPMDMSTLPQFAATGQALAAQNPPAPVPAASSYVVPPSPNLADKRQIMMGAPGRGTWAVPDNLPAFNPDAPSVVGVDPNYSAPDIAKRVNTLGQMDPGISGAISNFLHGSPYQQMGADQLTAAKVYQDPHTLQYFGSHPDMMTAAEHDPVNFARKLGAVLDAHMAGQSATPPAPGVVTHLTPDGVIAKHDPNPQMTTAVQNALGTTQQGAHVLAHPNQYSTEEFTRAAMGAGVTKGQLRAMWEMQHYLPPGQQAAQESLGLVNKEYMASPKDSAAVQQLHRNLRIIQGTPLFNDLGTN